MASTRSSTWQVACLCAEWCNVCRDWRAGFEALRVRHPGASFHWIDVEDEAEAMGDYDVETFPTLLVAQGDRVLFLGPVPPSAAQASRLLDRLSSQDAGDIAQPDHAIELLHRLKASLLLDR